MKSITKKASFRGDDPEKTNGAGADGSLPFGKLSSFRDEMAADVKDGTITYAHQEKLPRLPIPTLEETLDKFPMFLEALQTPKEHEETKRVVQEFKNGVGPKLQQALLEYDKEGYESGEFGSYVEEFWNEAYLSPDSSVVLNLNPFFVLEGGVSPNTVHGSHGYRSSIEVSRDVSTTHFSCVEILFLQTTTAGSQNSQ